MITYDASNLFASGPSLLHVGGIVATAAVLDTLHSRGVRMTHHGTAGRAITQSGQLIADLPLELQLLAQAIEAKVDGRVATLVDEHGRTFNDVVMLKFEPSAMEPLGTRWRVYYRIEYLQVNV